MTKTVIALNATDIDVKLNVEDHDYGRCSYISFILILGTAFLVNSSPSSLPSSLLSSLLLVRRRRISGNHVVVVDVVVRGETSCALAVLVSVTPPLPLLAGNDLVAAEAARMAMPVAVVAAALCASRVISRDSASLLRNPPSLLKCFIASSSTRWSCSEISCVDFAPSSTTRASRRSFRFLRAA